MTTATARPGPRERGIIFTDTVPALLDERKTQTRRLIKPQPPSVQAVRSLAGDGYRLSDRGTPGLWRVMGPVWAVRKLLDGDPVDARARADVGPQWRCPYGVPGDLLWVRETFYCDDYKYPEGPRAELLEAMEYRADHDCRTWEAGCPCSDEDGRSSWCSPLFMPRWASRLTLEITDVRVQRLQDITDEDAVAEGISFDGRWFPGAEHPIKGTPKVFPSARQAYASLWDSINGNRRRREWLSLGEPGLTLDKPWRMVRDESATWAANPWVWCLTFKKMEREP